MLRQCTLPSLRKKTKVADIFYRSQLKGQIWWPLRGHRKCSSAQVKIQHRNKNLITQKLIYFPVLFVFCHRDNLQPGLLTLVLGHKFCKFDLILPPGGNNLVSILGCFWKEIFGIFKLLAFCFCNNWYWATFLLLIGYKHSKLCLFIERYICSFSREGETPSGCNGLMNGPSPQLDLD